MRRFLLFSSLLWFAQSLISQNLNVAQHKGLDDAGDIVSINSGSFYWERLVDGCCGDELNVVGLNASGTIVWKKNLMYRENNIR